MFDTNIFNHLRDDMADLTPFIGKAKFLVTHIQLDEINNTPDETRRASLLHLFEEITNNSIPTESFVLGASRLGQAKLGGDSVIPTESLIWDVSRWDQAKWSADDNLYDPIRSKLDDVKKKPNNIQDAVIAETAIKNGLTLVTHDSLLFRVVTEFGGACTNIHQVIKELSTSS